MVTQAVTGALDLDDDGMVARRRQWLIEEGLARQEQDRVIYRADLMATLRRRDLAYIEIRPGEAIEGTLRRAVDCASGRFAVIEKSREFTLVPWRPVLGRHIGKQVSGVMRGDDSWTIGRQRSGPSVS